MSLLKATRPSGTSHRGQHRHRRAELVNVLEACRFLVCGEGWGGEGLRCWALRFQHRELQATHTKDGRHTKSQTCDAVSAAVVCCFDGAYSPVVGWDVGLGLCQDHAFSKQEQGKHTSEGIRDHASMLVNFRRAMAALCDVALAVTASCTGKSY